MFTRYLSIAVATLTLLGLTSVSSVADEKTTQQAHQMTIDHQAAMAQTQTDQDAIAKRLEDEAAELEKKAGEHERLAKQYRSGSGVGPKSNAASLATHCDSFVRNLRASANDAREMARMHRDIAKTLAK